LLEYEAREATRSVAALFDLVAVGVEDAVAEIDARARRWLDEQDLVGAHTQGRSARRRHCSAREAHRLANAVDDDEVVAGAVHLREA